MPNKEQNINKNNEEKVSIQSQDQRGFFIDYSISINLRKRNVLIWKHQQH